MENDIETLATALYVKIDDFLKERPDLAPARPETGTPITLSDAEVVTLTVMQVMLDIPSERKWIRYVKKHLSEMFPRMIGQSGFNKRVRKSCFLYLLAIRMLGMDTSLWSDDVWVVDSTPVQCGCSRETVTRSDAAGWRSMGTAPVTPGISGGCGCTWCARCTGCR